MGKFNNGKPYHGSEKIANGKLIGKTDTDYFYFFCPSCKEVLRILDYGVISDGPTVYSKEEDKKAKRDFTLAFELYCPKCKLHDFVKISNTGLQGGKPNNR